jgi:hypothetical protein
MIFNKKGQIENPMIGPILLVIIPIIAILVLGIFQFAVGSVTNAFLDVGVINTGGENGTNVTSTAEQTIGRVNDGISANSKWIAFFIIIANGIAIILINYLRKVHPGFIILYIFVWMIAIVMSATVANTYEDLLQDQTFGETFLEFDAATILVLYLPLWVSIIGGLGLVALGMGALIDRGAGGIDIGGGG